MRREHDGAEPRILRTDFCAALTTAEPASAGSGGDTGRTSVGLRSPNTLGNPLVSTVLRSASDSPLAWSGITALIPCRIALCRTERASPGIDDEPSGAATSQATSSTAIIE